MAKTVLSTIFILFCVIAAFGQSVRDIAAELLLQTENTSLKFPTDGSFPYHERVKFTSTGSPPDIKGQIIKDYLSSEQWRERSELFDYQRITVRSGRQVGEFRSAAFEPLSMELFRHSLPPVVMRLERTDKVKRITNRSINGKANKCIEYETRQERSLQENEVCVNEADGTLTSLRQHIIKGACVLGCRTETEWSDYSSFGGKLYPRHVRITKYRSVDAEVEFSAGSDLSSSSFRIPTNFEIRTACDKISPPMRLQGEPPVYPHRMNEWLFEGSIVVQARIGVDGRVQEARVAPHGKPQGLPGVTPALDGSDVDNAIVDAVRKWVFEPAKCDGVPMVENTLITFQAAVQ